MNFIKKLFIFVELIYQLMAVCFLSKMMSGVSVISGPCFYTEGIKREKTVGILDKSYWMNNSVFCNKRFVCVDVCCVVSNV